MQDCMVDCIKCVYWRGHQDDALTEPDAPDRPHRRIATAMSRLGITKLGCKLIDNGNAREHKRAIKHARWPEGCQHKDNKEIKPIGGGCGGCGKKSELCPECKSSNYIPDSGCWRCLDCGYGCD